MVNVTCWRLHGVDHVHNTREHKPHEHHTYGADGGADIVAHEDGAEQFHGRADEACQQEGDGTRAHARAPAVASVIRA